VIVLMEWDCEEVVCFSHVNKNRVVGLVWLELARLGRFNVDVGGF